MKKVIQKRQQAERQERIDKILQAGRRLFLKKGYIGATVRDIALEAEFSTGVIYFYFKGKDEIYGRICEEGFQILLDLFIKASKTEGTPLDRLVAMSKAYLKFFQKYPDYFDILSFRNMGFKQVGLPKDILERLEELSGKLIEIGHSVVVQGIEEGYINPGLDIEKVIQTQVSILLDGIRER